MFRNPGVLSWLHWHAGISITDLCLWWCFPRRDNHASLWSCAGQSSHGTRRCGPLVRVIDRHVGSRDTCPCTRTWPLLLLARSKPFHAAAPCCRWWLHFWNCSFDIQLHSIQAHSVDSWLRVPRVSLSIAEEHAISENPPWHSADAPGENCPCGVPITSYLDSSLIPDVEPCNSRA